jgi:hypothetical protein
MRLKALSLKSALSHQTDKGNPRWLGRRGFFNDKHLKDEK